MQTRFHYLVAKYFFSIFENAVFNTAHMKGKFPNKNIINNNYNFFVTGKQEFVTPLPRKSNGFTEAIDGIMPEVILSR